MFNYRKLIIIVLGLWIVLGILGCKKDIPRGKILFAYIPTVLRDYPPIKSNRSNSLLLVFEDNQKMMLSLPQKKDVVQYAYLSHDRKKVLVISRNKGPFWGGQKVESGWKNLWIYNLEINRWKRLWQTPDDFNVRWSYDNQHIIVNAILNNREIYQDASELNNLRPFYKTHYDKLFVLDLNGNQVFKFDGKNPLGGRFYLDPQHPSRIYCFTHIVDTPYVEKNKWVFESPLKDWDYTPFSEKTFYEVDYVKNTIKEKYKFDLNQPDSSFNFGEYANRSGFIVGRYYPESMKIDQFVKSKQKNFIYETVISNQTVRYSRGMRDEYSSGRDPISLDGRYILLTPPIEEPAPFCIYDFNRKEYKVIYGSGGNFSQAGFDANYFYYWKEIPLAKKGKTIQLENVNNLGAVWSKYSRNTEVDTICLDKNKQAWLWNTRFYGVYVQFYRVNLNSDDTNDTDDSFYAAELFLQ